MHSYLTLLTDVSLGIIFAALAAHVARILKQPPILGYVLGGVLLGANLGLGLVTSAESIEFISEIGLILLLFIIGLEINLRELARMGKAMLTLGIVQFVLCALIGAWFFGLIGYSNRGGRYDLLYVAVALALSSTMIVVKLLHDKFETATVAGRLTIGVLVLQDIWAIMFMAFQPNLLNPNFVAISRSLSLGLILVVLAFAASRYILVYLFKSAGRNPELILLTAIAWCFVVCGLAERAGLSKEMGALIAGMSIATFPYGADVTSKIGGVRDFFVTLFFVALGLKLPVLTWELLSVSLFAVAVVILSRLLSVIPTVALLGRGLRTGSVTAINLSQISEFSLVTVALGVGYGHVGRDVQMTVLIAMLTASVVSTYLIMFNDAFARLLVRLLAVFRIRSSAEAESASGAEAKEKRDIVLLGCFREGLELIEKIKAEMPDLKKRILVVDFNPVLREKIEPEGFKWAYGDLAHPETLHHLHVNHASLIICSVSDTFLKGTSNLKLLRSVREIAPGAHVIMTADDESTADALAQEGVAHVVIPGRLCAEYLFSAIKKECSR